MTTKLRADLLLLGITVVWGASFPLMKMVLAYIPAYAYLSIRFLLAALVLAVIFNKNLRRINKRALLYGGIIGLFMFGGMAFQVVGLYTTSASNSGFITGLNVVIVPVISAFLLKKRPDRASTIGIIIAFIGLFFLSGGLNFDFNYGDFLTFLCAICWAFQIIAIDRFTMTEDAPLLAILQLFFVGAASTGLWLTVDAGKPLEINGTVIGIILFTAVLGSALAFGGQTIAQKHTTPTHTALILTAEPVFAVIFAMIIPNAEGITEMPSLSKVVGCLLILAGMLVSELKLGAKKSKDETAERKASA
ncbi:MAG: DMT family transporter [Clostridiaceae bacterium]|nr:DMT family transporter [Clostridiaceae bacterium]